MIDPASQTCIQCGFAERPRAIEHEDGSVSEPTCLRCGLTANEHMPALRAALARAWSVATSMRLNVEGSHRADFRRQRA